MGEREGVGGRETGPPGFGEDQRTSVGRSVCRRSVAGHLMGITHLVRAGVLSRSVEGCCVIVRACLDRSRLLIGAGTLNEGVRHP